jgi:hypothetical protein
MQHATGVQRRAAPLIRVRRIRMIPVLIRMMIRMMILDDNGENAVP